MTNNPAIITHIMEVPKTRLTYFNLGITPVQLLGSSEPGIKRAIKFYETQREFVCAGLAQICMDEGLDAPTIAPQARPGNWPWREVHVYGEPSDTTIASMRNRLGNLGLYAATFTDMREGNRSAPPLAQFLTNLATEAGFLDPYSVVRAGPLLCHPDYASYATLGVLPQAENVPVGSLARVYELTDPGTAIVPSSVAEPPTDQPG